MRQLKHWQCKAKGCTGTVFQLNRIKESDLPEARCDGEQVIGKWKDVCNAAASDGYMPKGMKHYSCTTCEDFDLCLSCFDEVVEKTEAEDDSDFSTDLELTPKPWDSNRVDGCGSEILSVYKRKRIVEKTREARESTPRPMPHKRRMTKKQQRAELAKLAAVQEENDRFVLNVQNQSPCYY